MTEIPGKDEHVYFTPPGVWAAIATMDPAHAMANPPYTQQQTNSTES